MAVGICLPPKTVDAFKTALISGKINPEQLANMTSEARHKLFSDIVGEGNAKWVNSQFEAKTLLKDQQAGYLRWAKQLVGVKPEVRRDLISRIQKLDKILSPAEEKGFLKDLASTRLGIDVTAAEAKQIANMSSKLQDLATKQKPDGTFPTEADRMAYGYAKVDLGTYLADLKLASEKLSIMEQFKKPGHVVSKTAGLSKSLKASLDNSALFRQGWKTLFTNPKSWGKNAIKSFDDIRRQLGDQNVTREINAEIVSRPNYKQYEKMKLALAKIEEDYPTTIQNKIPILGRAFKASETAYTGFLHRMRADVADQYLKAAEAAGVDITDTKQLEAIGKLVNSLTGRADLGKFEGGAADALNNMFFSARFFKSNIDTLTAHQMDKNVTPFVRKQAAINLLKIAGGTAGVLAIADYLQPGSVEWDPRSSEFGKIKVGNTRFDVSGGMGSIVTLASRLAKQSTKNSATGVISKFNDGYGAKDGMDAFWNFTENKASPLFGVVRDLIDQEDFKGNKPTVGSTIASLTVPIPITTNIEAYKDPNSAPQLAVLIGDALGVGANTYDSTKRELKNDLTIKQKQFKDKVGEKKFVEANDTYNRRYQEWIKSNRNKLDQVPEEDKAAIISAAKTKIQTKIYKEYGFKAPKSQQSSTKKSLLDSLK